MTALLMGIDVGTTQTKVGVFHLDGRPAAMASARYPSPFDAAANAAEQNPAEWWAAAALAIRQALAEIDPACLLAVSVGGQGPTVVALDEALDPITPALTWMDLRAAPVARQLGERAGQPLPPHAFIAKVVWIKQTRPEVYAATRWFCQAWDFVAARLIGEPVASTSPGIAPWSKTWISVAELDDGKFPLLQPMGAPVGRVTAGAARDTGLPAGLPVIGGISDYFEGLIGSGALQPGTACDNGGTSQSFNLCWNAPLVVEGVFCIPSFDERLWYIGGPASTTGKALDWWREDVLECELDDWTALEAAARMPPGSDRLIFLPYLAGERAPLWDPQARGVFFGLSVQHRRGHLTRAILEAVAYTLCHLIERIEAAGAQVREIRACGGQAYSDLWCSIKADATGRPVVVPEVIEAPALGAAIIAGVGVQAFKDFAMGAERMVRVRQVFEADAGRHAHYQELYGIYRDLYRPLQSIYERLSRVGGAERPAGPFADVKEDV
jgi:xylulokinase